MKKLIKNKVFILSISLIILSFIYLFAQKAIDNYFFYTNSDISVEEGEGNRGENNLEDKEQKFKVKEENLSKVLEENVEVVVEESEINSNDNIEESEESKKTYDNTIIEEKKIFVYITGEVINPGVVILNEGSRIVDAINAAVGTTSNANVTKVNLVFILEDGMKVNIPNNSDLKNNSNFEYITLNSGDGRNDDYIRNDSDSKNTKSSYSKSYDIVNINTATQTELESLPGIGPSLALKIINYRKENGKFSSIEEIKNVSGIGESKFEKLKKYVNI